MGGIPLPPVPVPGLEPPPGQLLRWGDQALHWAEHTGDQALHWVEHTAGKVLRWGGGGASEAAGDVKKFIALYNPGGKVYKIDNAVTASRRLADDLDSITDHLEKVVAQLEPEWSDASARAFIKRWKEFKSQTSQFTNAVRRDGAAPMANTAAYLSQAQKKATPLLISSGVGAGLFVGSVVFTFLFGGIAAPEVAGSAEGESTNIGAAMATATALVGREVPALERAAAWSRLGTSFTSAAAWSLGGAAGQVAADVYVKSKIQHVDPWSMSNWSGTDLAAIALNGGATGALNGLMTLRGLLMALKVSRPVAVSTTAMGTGSLLLGGVNQFWLNGQKFSSWDAWQGVLIAILANSLTGAGEAAGLKLLQGRSVKIVGVSSRIVTPVTSRLAGTGALDSAKATLNSANAIFGKTVQSVKFLKPDYGVVDIVVSFGSIPSQIIRAYFTLPGKSAAVGGPHLRHKLPPVPPLTGPRKTQKRGHAPHQPAEYTVPVPAGDSLWQMAHDNPALYQAVKNANPRIKNPALIWPGEKVHIPNVSVRVTVHSGDTLWSLAGGEEAEYQAIRGDNRQIKNPALLHPGEKIWIPAMPPG